MWLSFVFVFILLLGFYHLCAAVSQAAILQSLTHRSWFLFYVFGSQNGSAASWGQGSIPVFFCGEPHKRPTIEQALFRDALTCFLWTLSLCLCVYVGFHTHSEKITSICPLLHSSFKDILYQWLLMWEGLSAGWNWHPPLANECWLNLISQHAAAAGSRLGQEILWQSTFQWFESTSLTSPVLPLRPSWVEHGDDHVELRLPRRTA